MQDWKDEHWKKNTNTAYLGTYSFEDVVGEGTNATISRLEKEEVYNTQSGKKELCIIAHFVENIKPMVLNKGACKTITALMGSAKPKDWKGCRFFIVVRKEKVRGLLMPVLRIEQPSKNATPQKAQPPQPTAAPPEPLPACNDCKQSIDTHEGVPAEKIVAVSKKRYGVPLCGYCYTARKEAEQSETEDTQNESDA